MASAQIPQRGFDNQSAQPYGTALASNVGFNKSGRAAVPVHAVEYRPYSNVAPEYTANAPEYSAGKAPEYAAGKAPEYAAYESGTQTV